MTRPPAILRFERLYLGSTLAWFVGAALSWDERSRMMAGNAALVGYEWLVPGGFALVLAISLLLWWLAAHRRSLGARVGVLATAVVSAIFLVLTAVAIVSGSAMSLPVSLLQVLSSALCIAAAASLFANDARAWFADPAEPMS